MAPVMSVLPDELLQISGDFSPSARANRRIVFPRLAMRDDTIHDRKRTGWRPAAIDLGQETLIGDGDSVRVFIDTTDPRTSAILTESHEGDHHPDVLDGTHVPDHPEPD